MSTFLRTPSQGLKILEKLHQNNPYHQGIINNLINAYIRFGEHDKAINMIADIPDDKTDVQSLKFKAWVEYKNNNMEKERRIWDSILYKSYRPDVHNMTSDLIKMTQKEIRFCTDQVVVFCNIRNELIRLPYLLQHYRNLGVDAFVFVDNNSNDGSLEYLLQQHDCHIYWTNNHYTQSGAGTSWLNQLIKKYINENQWILLIDADEFLIYPNCEDIDIKTLILYLNNRGEECISSYMLDMFPKNLNDQMAIQSGDNLLKKSPYFYNKYVFYHDKCPPYQRPNGGIFQYFNIDVLYQKTSLVKYNKDFYFYQNSHFITPKKVANMTSVYLHFKFIGDFYKNSKIETIRKVHSRGAVRYKFYAKLYEESISKDFDLTLLEKTTKYQNSQQLVDLGLIQCPDDWLEFIKNEKNDE